MMPQEIRYCFKVLTGQITPGWVSINMNMPLMRRVAKRCRHITSGHLVDGQDLAAVKQNMMLQETYRLLFLSNGKIMLG